MGCRACRFAYTNGGVFMCKWEPHDFKTYTQRDIVAWLSIPGRDAMDDDGCPGFMPSHPHPAPVPRG